MRDILIIATVLIVSALAGLGVPLVMPVQALSEETPPCEPIAHAGAALIFRCEDEDSGQVLYVNQMGFMILGE